MKKIKNTFILSGALLLFLNNNTYAATTNSTSVSYTKYIAIAIAAIIILLLLFLGYKMDTKEPDIYEVKRTKRKKEKKVKEDVNYEPDTVSYENDVINTNDLVEPVEYDESEEESLFNLNNDEVDDSEDYGEEFDTSIIDSIDDEDDIVIPGKAKDETMVFDKPPVKKETKIEEEIESLDNELNIENVDPTMSELNNIDKTETSFEGFSVSDENEEKKPHKKYTKAKKTDDSTQKFLDEIEENLKKDKEERNTRNKK